LSLSACWLLAKHLGITPETIKHLHSGSAQAGTLQSRFPAALMNCRLLDLLQVLDAEVLAATLL